MIQRCISTSFSETDILINWLIYCCLSNLVLFAFLDKKIEQSVNYINELTSTCRSTLSSAKLRSQCGHLTSFSLCGGGLVSIWDILRSRLCKLWPPGTERFVLDLLAPPPMMYFLVSAGVQTWFAIAIWSNNKVTQFIDIFCWGRQACLQRGIFDDGVQRWSAFKEKAISINIKKWLLFILSKKIAFTPLMPKYSTFQCTLQSIGNSLHCTIYTDQYM